MWVQMTKTKSVGPKLPSPELCESGVPLLDEADGAAEVLEVVVHVMRTGSRLGRYRVYLDSSISRQFPGLNRSPSWRTRTKESPINIIEDLEFADI